MFNLYIRRIKRSCINHIKSIIHYKEYCKKFPDHKKYIYLIGTSKNGNLGDQAISYTQRKLLESNSHRDIVEITIDEYWCARKFLKKRVTCNDPIFIQGGGNFGIEYWLAEESRRDLIQMFRHNKIVSFPQTIDYGDSKLGRTELLKSQKIYNRHEDLHLFAREKFSYEQMTKVYGKNNVYLTPDIVFLCDIRPSVSTKKLGILLCLRKDCEATLTEADRIDIKKIAQSYGICCETDTCIDQDVAIEEREHFIRCKLNEFASAQVVITDRLHGMVFAVLAGVPCVVFRNYNRKVEGIYEWLKDIPWLKMCKSIDELGDALATVMSTPIIKFSPERYKCDFSPLIKLINGCV